MNGSLLRELRKTKGIGQVELANRVGVTQCMISQLELGCRNPRPDTLEAIAQELGSTVEALAGEPSAFVRLMRNCRGLLPAQLIAINEVVLQLKKCGSPADTKESAGTSTNTARDEILRSCVTCNSRCVKVAECEKCSSSFSNWTARNTSPVA